MQEKVGNHKWLWEGGIFEAKHHNYPDFTKLSRKDQLLLLRMSWFADHHSCFIKWTSFDKQRNRLEREEIALTEKFCETVNNLNKGPLLEKLWLKYEREGSLLDEKIKKLENQRKEVFSYY